jgi:hypothetical protein
VLAQAGLVDDFAGARTTAEAIRSDPSLSPAQKEALLAVYRSYAREQESTEAESE